MILIVTRLRPLKLPGNPLNPPEILLNAPGNATKTPWVLPWNTSGNHWNLRESSWVLKPYKSPWIHSTSSEILSDLLKRTLNPMRHPEPSETPRDPRKPFWNASEIPWKAFINPLKTLWNPLKRRWIFLESPLRPILLSSAQTGKVRWIFVFVTGK